MKTIKNVMAIVVIITMGLGMVSIRSNADSKDFPSAKVKKVESWSGYVYRIEDRGTYYTYYTSCGVTGTTQSRVEKSQVTSLERKGTCYQYSLYYLVYNY